MKTSCCLIFLFLCIQIYGEDYQTIQEFQIDAIGDQWLDRPVILARQDSGFVVLWVTISTLFSGQWYESFGSWYAFLGQRFDQYGEKNGATFQYKAKLDNVNSVAFTNNGVVALWSIYNNVESYGDIHGRLFDKDFQEKGEEFIVFSNPNCISGDPSVAIFENDDFFTVWNNYLEEKSLYSEKPQYNILGRRFYNNGVKDGKPIQINEQPSEYLGNPNIIILSNGDFVVSWESTDSQDSLTGLFGRLFDSTGIAKGSEIFLQKKPTLPSIAPLSNGFIITWIRTTLYDDSILYRIYDENLSPKSHSKAITTQQSKSISEMSITSISEDIFAVAWVDRLIDSQIYCQVLNDSGEKIGQVIEVSDHKEGNVSQSHHDVSGLNGGRFVVTWECGDHRILGKMYDVKPLVRPLLPFTLIEPKNDATLKTKRVFFCWEQPGHLKEYNPLEITFSLYLDRQPDFSNPLIVENIIDTTYSSMETLLAGTTYFWKVSAINSAGDSLWSSNVNGFYVSPNATSVESPTKIPEGFALEQNYPNPFNPSTEIKYSIPSTGFAMLKIYDIQGRLIRVLCEGNQTAGSYTLRWDGKDESGQAVSSGIYVYKLSFKNSQGQITVITRKMGLVR